MKKLVWILTAAVMAVVACAQKKEQKNHAPMCSYGQVLSYQDSTGYSCKVAINNTSGYGGSSQYDSQYYGGLQAVYVPVLYCLNSTNTPDVNQTLVQWNNSFICMYNDMLRPEGSDSPKGYFPVGRGGEWCNASSVICAPGYYCQMANQNLNGTPGVTSQVGGSCQRAYF
jgi:hypothetical protein